MIGRNYYGATGELMKRVMKSGSSRQRRVAAGISAKLDSYFDKLRQLPRLPEREPPAERWAAYAKSSSVMASESARQAAEASIIRHLATTITLKFGHKYICRVDDNGPGGRSRLTDIQSLKRFQVSTEMPRMENVASLLVDYNLSVFRNETELSVES